MQVFMLVETSLARTSLVSTGPWQVAHFSPAFKWLT